MPLEGSNELLGSGDPSDTHDAIIVAPSGCGKTALILRLILHFWQSFNNITLLSPQLDPSQVPAPEDDDWLLLKRLPREKKIAFFYEMTIEPLVALLKQRTVDPGTSDVLIIDDKHLRGKQGQKICNYLCNNLENMRKRHLVLFFVAFSYNGKEGITKGFRELFKHTFYFCDPALTNNGALTLADNLNVVDPDFGNLSFTKCVTKIKNMGCGNLKALPQILGLTYPPNQRQCVLYVNSCSQKIYDVTSNESRRMKPTSTGGVEHCEPHLLNGVTAISLPFHAGSRASLFVQYAEYLLPVGDPRCALLLADGGGGAAPPPAKDVSFSAAMAANAAKSKKAPGRPSSGAGECFQPSHQYCNSL
jgi:hypothetical protein